MPIKTNVKPVEKGVKGDEAEEIVLRYLKQVNRPYAATDISANLKNKVNKTTAQKVLITLAEKGALTVKHYGKQSIFVYNQANLETLPVEGLADVQNDIKAIANDLESMRKKTRVIAAAIASLESQPRTQIIPDLIKRLQSENSALLALLKPLRAAAAGEGQDTDEPGHNAGPMSKEEVELIEKDWQKWRKEWFTRKKTCLRMLDECQGEKSAAEFVEFTGDLGIESDTPEMIELEASDLCKPPRPKKIALLGVSGKQGIVITVRGQKRKRV